MELINLNNLSFNYGKEKKNLIDNISLEIKKGDFDFLIGLNGAGKTTLLKLLTRQLLPTSGQINLKGKSIEDYPLKKFSRVVGYVPQSYESLIPFTLFDFVASGRTPYMNFFGIPSETDLLSVNEYISLLEIEKIADKKITEISGGELRRAMLARALAQNPEVLILDEPNAHLDIEHQLKIFKLLEKLNREKELTIITVSHDLNLTAMFSKNIILLEKGNVVKTDSKDFLKEDIIKKYFNVNTEIKIKNNFTTVTIVRD